MRAVLVKENSDDMYIGQYDKPQPDSNELLVKVVATAVNRSDLLQRKGLYPLPDNASPILGLEIAGIVVEKGIDVDKWEVGEEVMALLPGGGYAEYAAVPEDVAMEKPENLSFEEAAGIPEAFLTAYLKLILLGEAKENETVLIHAGGSGVGTAAIQLAKEKKAKSIVTAGSPEKLEVCRGLGANALVNYKTEDFSQIVLKETNNKGVDLILDFIGASFWDQNFKSISTDGRWILIGVLGGFEKMINLRQMMHKRIRLIGSTLRPRSETFKEELVKDFSLFSKSRFEDGRLKPVVDKVFSWKNVAEAHQYMEENKNIGKIILKID